MSVRDIITDRAYFTRRAREEREYASVCEDNAAAVAHLKMAEEYEKRANNLSSSKPRMVPG
ncbi:MAG: hypothetical protein JWN66_4346 [Sphingomonas bacterium]|nr:hypothetical protein [Sphingomonas bacterium]